MKLLLLLEPSLKDLTRNDEGGIQADVSLIYLAEVLKADGQAAAILRPTKAATGVEGAFLFMEEAKPLVGRGSIDRAAVERVARDLDRMACRAQGAVSILAVVDKGGHELRRMKDLSDLVETLAGIWVRAADPSLSDADGVALLKGRTLAPASAPG